MQTRHKTYYRDNSIQISKTLYKKTESDIPMHSHNFLTISLLLNGSIVEKTSDSQIHHANLGHVSIKPPKVLHSDDFVEDSLFLSIKIYDWEYYQLDFTQWNWVAEHKTLLPHFLTLIKERNKKEAVKELKSAIQYCLEQKIQSVQTPNWVLDIAAYISENYEETILITEIAKRVGKHPFHVGLFFKRYYGVDIKTYQQYLRIQYSLATAVEQNKSLTEIAYQNGFSDQSHFCRTFKKITQFTPKKALHLIDV